MATKARKLKKRARKLVGAGVQATRRTARKAVPDRTRAAGVAAAALAAVALAARTAKRTLSRPETIAGARSVAQSAGKAAAMAAIATVLEMARRELERRSRR